jgi:hypothetical protein
MAIADIVELQQPLPLRWPVGDDAVRTIPLRAAMPDDLWEQHIRTQSAGYRRLFFEAE